MSENNNSYLSQQIEQLNRRIAKLEQPRKIDIVKLATGNVSLSGKFNPNSDVVVLCDALYGSFTVYLPQAAGSRGNVLYFNKVDLSGNIITLQPLAGEKINLDINQTLELPGDNIGIVSSGASWFTVSSSVSKFRS